jgi:hypothetical protein
MWRGVQLGGTGVCDDESVRVWMVEKWSVYYRVAEFERTNLYRMAETDPELNWAPFSKCDSGVCQPFRRKQKDTDIHFVRSRYADHKRREYRCFLFQIYFCRRVNRLSVKELVFVLHDDLFYGFVITVTRLLLYRTVFTKNVILCYIFTSSKLEEL